MSFSLTDHPQWASLLSFIQQAEGPLILHISDTETASYPFVEKLIAAVKPAEAGKQRAHEHHRTSEAGAAFQKVGTLEVVHVYVVCRE